MRKPPTSVHVNKPAAARRQLDLAIRLFFAREDELGVHTLASAAFTILRNLFRSRKGHFFAEELLRHGFHNMAHEYAAGKMPKEMIRHVEQCGLKQAFEKIVEEERQAGKVDPSRVSLLMKSEERAWSSRAAGFLKHATKDPDSHLAVDTLRNEDLLIGACTAYLQIMTTPSPEIIAFSAFWAAKNDADIGEQARPLLAKLKSVEEPARYHLCAKFICNASKKQTRGAR
jgi:hypothetical protein